ncbi:hypothetical protein DFH09DRAFT_1309584 [Mycena vulgaris]|nr:hypothetical protein DFH09DRAFT_1309584 [Mycena vulgaris]
MLEIAHPSLPIIILHSAASSMMTSTFHPSLDQIELHPALTHYQSPVGIDFVLERDRFKEKLRAKYPAGERPCNAKGPATVALDIKAFDIDTETGALERTFIAGGIGPDHGWTVEGILMAMYNALHATLLRLHPHPEDNRVEYPLIEILERQKRTMFGGLTIEINIEWIVGGEMDALVYRWTVHRKQTKMLNKHSTG